MNNILLIIQNLCNGGAEHSICMLANSLKEKYNVTMVVFDNEKREYQPNVEVINLKIPDSKNFIKKIFNIFNRIKKVRKIKAELKIDCCISFLSGPNIVNVFSKQKDKTIISIRNMQSNLKKNIFRDLINIISLKKADKIITVSNSVKNDIEEYYKIKSTKMETIYNMVDIKEISKMKNESVEENFLFKKDEIYIINIGRLTLQKGQWHLLKAFKIVKEKFPQSKLIILGRGELKNSLQNLISKLELTEDVFFLNFKTNPYKYLAKSDIFVSTSLYEGMSNVILEAMACNIPVIATDCNGGTKEILYNQELNEKYGFLIPKFDKKYNFDEKIDKQEIKLAEAIIELIENKEKINYYKEKAIKRIKDFNCEKIQKKWIDVIESINKI